MGLEEVCLGQTDEAREATATERVSRALSSLPFFSARALWSGACTVLHGSRAGSSQSALCLAGCVGGTLLSLGARHRTFNLRADRFLSSGEPLLCRALAAGGRCECLTMTSY